MYRTGLQQVFGRSISLIFLCPTYLLNLVWWCCSLSWQISCLNAFLQYYLGWECQGLDDEGYGLQLKARQAFHPRGRELINMEFGLDPQINTFRLAAMSSSMTMCHWLWFIQMKTPLTELVVHVGLPQYWVRVKWAVCWVKGVNTFKHMWFTPILSSKH